MTEEQVEKVFSLLYNLQRSSYVFRMANARLAGCTPSTVHRDGYEKSARKQRLNAARELDQIVRAYVKENPREDLD